MNITTRKSILVSTFCGALLLVTAPVMAKDKDKVLQANLSGAQEVPEVDTPAKGKARLKFDAGFTEVEVSVEVKGLVGSVTGVHLHCARPSANGPVAVGLISPGMLVFNGKKVKGTLTNADFTGADCVPSTGRPITNVAGLAFAAQDGLIYVNVHTDAHPPGEIRGQFR